MPRFVILRHETPPGGPRPLHWDFMLEGTDTLRTWALQREPTLGVWIEATVLPDHRKTYLEYEGPVGGNRGTVVRWDGGDFQWDRQNEFELVVQLAGQKLHGPARLVRDGQNAQRWLAWFAPG